MQAEGITAPLLFRRMVAIDMRRFAIDVFEAAYEIVGAGEARLFGDFIHAQSCMQQKVFRVFKLIFKFKA